MKHPFSMKLALSTIMIVGIMMLVMLEKPISQPPAPPPSVLQSGTPTAPPLKIASADFLLLFQKYHRTTEFQIENNHLRSNIQKELNERSANLREQENQVAQLRKQVEDPSISDSRKQNLLQNYQLKQEELISLHREQGEFAKRKQTALNENTLQRMKEIVNEIRKVVEEHAKLENYDYLFDKSGTSSNQIPMLLYAKDAADITPALLTLINRGATTPQHHDLTAPNDSTAPLKPN